MPLKMSTEPEHKPIRRNKFWMYLTLLGPGLTTGAADDDPSGIATYSQTGAQFGYGMTWLMLFSYPLMIVIQEICARDSEKAVRATRAARCARGGV